MQDDNGPRPATRLPSALRALGHRNYRLFFAGQLVSLVGMWMQSVAQSWLVYRLTGSAILLGLVSFSGQIPVFLLAPLGGAFADKYPRRHTRLNADDGDAPLSCSRRDERATARVHSSCGSRWLVNAFDIPAQSSSWTGGQGRLVKPRLNSSMFNGARIIGPAVAGLLIVAVGEGWCFLANAVSYTAVIAGLLSMRVAALARPRGGGSAVEKIKEGFVFVGRTGPVRALMLLLGLVSLMGMPYAVLMPIFADRILGGGPRGLGILMGASGLGARRVPTLCSPEPAMMIRSRPR